MHGSRSIRDGWYPPIHEEDREALAENVKQLRLQEHAGAGALALYNRTGGGLMAELGSHQLDACSIFLRQGPSAGRQGVGGKFFYRDEEPARPTTTSSSPSSSPARTTTRKTGRQADEQGQGQDDVVVVTYSSVNTNSFEPYGEMRHGQHGARWSSRRKRRSCSSREEPEPRRRATSRRARR